MAAATTPDIRDSLIRDNECLKLYYQHQQVCPSDELPLMWAAFTEELPVTFRLTCSGDLALATQQYYSKDAQIIETTTGNSLSENGINEENSKILDRPEQIDIIPHSFRMKELNRRSIRKNESAKYFRSRLINDSERGALQRQELVSMIPPLFLRVNTTDRVIDLCAAPGSKTSQMIDAIHRENCRNGIFQLPEDAAVLANDVSLDRARLLSHQLGKVASPIVATVCADALGFPKAETVDTLFTKVLCDVPCTGDGTVRKNPEIWREWHVKHGIDLHGRQFKILVRGIELLAPGGRLVYSTCSLNPIENEAVVAAALSQYESELQLLDVFEDIAGLPAGRGLETWKVPNPFAWLRFTTESDLEKKIISDSLPKNRKKRKIARNAIDMDDVALKKRVSETRVAAQSAPLFCDTMSDANDPDILLPTMFPTNYSPDILAQMRKTARFMPHQKLNSGGFFCALFQRRPDAPAPIKKRSRKSVESAEVTAEIKKGSGSRKVYDDIVKPALLPESIADDLISFYGLSSVTKDREAPSDKGLVANTEALTRENNCELSASRELGQIMDLGASENTKNGAQWLHINGACDRRIYLASPKLLEMHGASKNLDFISIGSKVFEKMDERFRQTSACDYRLTNDGVVWLLGYMRRRVICGNYKAMRDSLCRDGLTRPYLLELEAAGSIWNLDSCRRKGLLESGGCVMIADGDLGLIRMACLLTGNGNVLPLLKKCLRPGLVQMLSEGHQE